MSIKKSEIKQINKALQLLKRDIKKTTELMKLPWEYMHEEHVLILQ